MLFIMLKCDKYITLFRSNTTEKLSFQKKKKEKTIFQPERKLLTNQIVQKKEKNS